MNATLLQMAKSTDKNSLRNYGTVIGIQNGRAYTTDGFSMLRWIPNEKIPGEKSLNTDLSESPVRFPKAEAVFPNTPGTGVKTELFEDLPKSAKIGIGRYFLIEVNGQEARLIPECEEKNPKWKYFNPSLFLGRVKGIPRNAKLNHVKIHDDVLIANYLGDHGEFDIVLVAIRIEK